MRAKAAADLLGVTSATVRRWSIDGRLPFTLSAAGQRIYDEHEVLVAKAKMLGEDPPIASERVVFYLRSSEGSTSHLESQLVALTAQYGEPVRVFKDKGSGLNDRRPGLRALRNAARRGEFTKVAVTHKDRLTRFGFDYLSEHFQDLGVEIVCGEAAIKSPQEELLADFMALIASFSGKFYRLRGWEQQRKLLANAEREISHRAS